MDRGIDLKSQPFHIIEQLGPFPSLGWIIGVVITGLSGYRVKEKIRLGKVQNSIWDRDAEPIWHYWSVELEKHRCDMDVCSPKMKLSGRWH